MKKERPTLCQRCLQFGHQKKGKMRDCRGNFCLYCKEPHKTEDKKICEKYKMEAKIQKNMRLDKCDMYTTKETERDNRRNKPTENYRSPPISRRDEPIKKQNRENEEKERNTYRQETEEATGREKVDEEAIKKRRTQKEIVTKPKIMEDKNTKEKREKNKSEERNKKAGNTFSVLQ